MNCDFFYGVAVFYWPRLLFLYGKYRIILNIFDRTGVVMDEYRAGETNAVVLAGMCTALAVVLSVIGFYMPLISLVVFLLIPLPIAYLGMKEGTSWSIIVTAGIMILDSVFSDSFPPLSFAPSSACLA